MAVTSQALQLQMAELEACCPVLPLSILPRMHVDDDLWGTVRAEGKQERESFRHFLTSAAKQAHTCCTCSCDGQATAEGSSSSHGDGSSSSKHQAAYRDESTVLRFTTFTSASFTDRSIRYTHAGFACGKCRAMRDVAQFIKCAALRLGPQYPEREQLMKDLSLHFAMLNSAPEAVQVNPDALIVWIQELYSRAYALQVVASNLRGWKVLGPTDQPALFGTAGASLNMAKQLLAAGANKSERLATPVVKVKKVKNGPKASASTPSASKPAAASGDTPAKKQTHTTTPAPAAASLVPTAAAPKSLKKRKSGVMATHNGEEAVTVVTVKGSGPTPGKAAAEAAPAAAVVPQSAVGAAQTPKRKKLRLSAASDAALLSPVRGSDYGLAPSAVQHPTSPHPAKPLSAHKKKVGASKLAGSVTKLSVVAVEQETVAAESPRPKSAAKGKKPKRV